MIFYNPQLMQDDRQLRLFLVSNPKAFTRFKDHRAALEIQIHLLIESAIAEKEDPIALVEDYLNIPYNEGNTIADIANFIINSPQMTRAMHTLKENWDTYDQTLPEDSLLYGGGTSREQAVTAFSEISLRSYLEALSAIYEH